jgi:Tol biopolymer transport system component
MLASRAVTLSGARLGPYEIVGLIGAGGMGEVWHARDTRLGRSVAVKVIHRGATLDETRLGRFELEARAAGILNHPNILAVYDVGTYQGAPYLVTEMLDGETMRARLAEGPIPPSRAIDFGAQIASGLAGAHAKGIVHRDLKPENLFVCRDGRVKILDFGLAKLTDTAASIEEVSRASTIDSSSDSVRLMGTVSYMSPEQIRARPVDHRSDVFAFGAVLYEMLTGQRAFHRESAVETMNATLKEEPPYPEEAFPRGLDLVVQRCLEKEPERRFQSANDLAFQLATLGSLTGSASRPLPAAPPPPPRRRWLRPALAGLLAAAGIAGGFLVGRGTGGDDPPAYQQLTFRRGTILSARLAPDGQTIVYGAAWDGQPLRLFSTRAESPESRALDLPDGDILAISRTGEMAVSLGRRYTVGSLTRGTLARVPLVGGAPREMATDVDGADWGPDGELAVVRVTGGRYSLEYPLGTTRYATEGWISHPRVSPDGTQVAFIDHPVYADDRGSIAVIGAAGTKKTLTHDWASANGLAWAPGGRELWFTASELGPNCALRAVSLQGRSRIVMRSAGRLVLQDIRGDGQVLLTEGRFRIGMIHRGADGKERDLSWLDISLIADISADGKTLLFTEHGIGTGIKSYASYARGVDGSPALRLGDGMAGAFSPDGRSVLSVILTSPPHLTVWPMPAGQPKRVEDLGVTDLQSVNWLPDGQRILFSATRGTDRARLYVTDLAGHPPQPISGEGLRVPYYAKPVSPDGTLVAALDDDGRVLLQPVAGGDPRVLEGLLPGEVPVRWSADGKALFVFRFGELPGRLFRFNLEDHRKDLLAEMLPADPAGVGQIITVQVAPDGRSCAYSYKQILSELYLVGNLR